MLIVGWVLIGFEAVYVLAANTVLRTRSLDRWVTGATEGLYLRVEPGWTLWPGRVHVKRTELHFEDYNIQLSVWMDAAVIDLSLWQLVTKTFHLNHVRAEGVHCVLRHKVASVDGIEQRLALYPKIAGYSDPPLFRGPKAPPLTDEQYDLWTIQLEDVDAEVEELWFLEYRFTGKARAKGGFRLKPERDARTDLCSLTLDGTLRAGEQTVASKLTGRLEAQLDRHDPRVVEGAQIFAKISVNTNLHAAIPDLDFTELYTDADGPHLSGGKGSLDMRAELRHGAWMTTTKVRYQTVGVRLAEENLSIAGAIAMRADIVKPGKDATLDLTAAASSLNLSFKGSPKALEGPSVRDFFTAIGVSANLTRPIRLTSFESHLKAHAPELRWLNYPFKSKDLFASGSGHANVNLKWSEDEVTNGSVRLDVKDAGFTLAEQIFQVSGNADAQSTYDPDKQSGHVRRLTLDLPQLAVSAKNGWQALPGGLQAHAERLTWRKMPPERFQGRFELNAGTVEPLLPIVISSALVRTIATALTRMGKTHAMLEVDHTPAATELRLEEAQSGDVHVNGILRDEKSEKNVCGRFYIRTDNLSVGVVLRGGETSVKPFVSSNWWRERPPITSCAPELASDGKTSASTHGNGL